METHLSKAEIEEMERRKRNAAEIGEDNRGEAQTGEYEQEADRERAQRRTRVIDPVITGSPD